MRLLTQSSYTVGGCSRSIMSSTQSVAGHPLAASLSRPMHHGVTPSLTMRTAISHGMNLLAQNPDQRRVWQDDLDGVTPTAVEEIIRVDPAAYDAILFGLRSFLAVYPIPVWTAAYERAKAEA